MKQFLLYNFGLAMIVSFLLASEYEEGETVSVEHQNVVFTQCYGYDGDSEKKLADYLGKVLWIEMSATWCDPCWGTIPDIDEIVLQWDGNDNVASFVSLADLGWPDQPTCEQWGVEGNPFVPIIVDGGSTLSGTDYISNWFSEGPYASYVFIDHTMTVRHMINNTAFSVELANQWIEEMLGNLDVKDDEVKLPAVFSLRGNYPNPFNAITTIEYELKENSAITLSIFDIDGREVDVIVNDYQFAGKHSIVWNSQNIPSGIYFIRLSTKDFIQTRKAILLK